MKVTVKKNFSLLVMLVILICTSCSEKTKTDESMALSQVDIDLLVQHKKKIDQITKKYDSILSKTKNQNKKAVTEKGKAEINKYLKTHNLNPTFFMRKSKKILKGYIAFFETGKSAVEKRKKMLVNQNLSKKEIEVNIKAFKKERERVFKELTSGLSDYEIELIRTNLKKLSSVVNL